MRLRGRGGSGGTLDWLVVGLGNPGRRYERTPHNLGFRALDVVGARLGAGWRGRYSGRFAEVRDGDRRLALLKPETYMNDCGRSVAPAVGFYKLPLERLLVVHDEIDLDVGDVRVKVGGGLAGHNGLRSIVAALGTRDFVRVRIGVGRPERGDPRPVADWLLAPVAPGVDLDALAERGADAALDTVRLGPDAAMREWNGRGAA
jgi:peptidyl-tRNA hydrolase, PTH1 family